MGGAEIGLHRSQAPPCQALIQSSGYKSMITFKVRLSRINQPTTSFHRNC